MKSKLYILLFCVLGFLSSCGSNTIDPPVPDPVPEKADRTVLVYIAADNDLAKYVTGFGNVEGDIPEMVKGIAGVDTKKNNLLVYVDTGKAYLIRLCNNSHHEAVLDTLKTYSARNSVGVAEMKEVLDEVFTDYPAKSYGLTLWSHGEGATPVLKSSLSDAATRWFGEDGSFRMDIPDLRAALQDIPHLDFLLFDACFMHSVEVLYELRDVANYFIGSPGETPGPGAPYHLVVPAFFGNGTPEEVAKNIAVKYSEPYVANYSDKKSTADSPWTGGIAMGVLKSVALGNLGAVTREVLAKYLEYGTTVDVSEYGNEVMYYGRNLSGSMIRYYYYTDMDGFIDRITGGNADYERWRTSFDAAMISYLHTPKIYSMGENRLPYRQFTVEGGGGLSMYIHCRASTPNRTEFNTYFKNNYQWYQAVGWGDLGW